MRRKKLQVGSTVDSIETKRLWRTRKRVCNEAVSSRGWGLGILTASSLFKTSTLSFFQARWLMGGTGCFCALVDTLLTRHGRADIYAFHSIASVEIYISELWWTVVEVLKLAFIVVVNGLNSCRERNRSSNTSSTTKSNNVYRIYTLKYISRASNSWGICRSYIEAI